MSRPGRAQNGADRLLGKGLALATQMARAYVESHRPNHRDQSPAAPANVDVGTPPVRNEQPVSGLFGQSPFAEPERAIMRGPMDAVNCGEYSFWRYNVQLGVSLLGTAGSVGGEYDVTSLKPHVWTRLIGRDQEPLPILVFRDHSEMTVLVGNVPAGPAPTLSPTR